jgi:hypothetical protein
LIDGLPLRRHVRQGVHRAAKGRRTAQPLGVPGDVLARHPHAGFVAIKNVERLQVIGEDGVDFRHLRRRTMPAGGEVMGDFAEQPGAALRGTADHHAVGAGMREHVAGFFRRRDVAVGDHRNADGGLHRGNRVVLGLAAILIGARAAVYGDGADAGRLGEARNPEDVAVFAVPAGAAFEGDRRFRHGLHHRFEDARHERLVLEQRRAGHDVAHLLGRTAHVDVDDLRAVRDVVTRRRGEHARIGAGDLHGDRLDLAGVVGAPQGLGAAVEQRVGSHHLGNCEAGAQLLAQLPERAVGDARHGRHEEIVAQGEAAEFHANKTGEAPKKGADSTPRSA